MINKYIILHGLIVSLYFIIIIIIIYIYYNSLFLIYSMWKCSNVQLTLLEFKASSPPIAYNIIIIMPY